MIKVILCIILLLSVVGCYIRIVDKVLDILEKNETGYDGDSHCH